MLYLAKHPYVGRAGPGRSKNSLITKLTDKQKARRRRLLAQYGNVKRRRKRRVLLGIYLDNDEDDEEVRNIADAIREVGGVPKSWNVQ